MPIARSLEWWRPEDSRERWPRARPRAVEVPPASDRVAFVALMFFTLVLLLAPQLLLPSLAPLHLAMVAGCVAIAANLVSRLSRASASVAIATEVWIAFGLALWAVLSAPLSLWPSGSVGFLFDPFAKSLILFWLLSSAVVTIGRVRCTAWLLALITVPLALTGLWHLLSGVFLPGGAAAGYGRIAGYEAPLTANPNDLALMLNLILPLGVALLLSERRWALKVLAVAVVTLSVFAIIATFSRGGFLTLMTVCIAYMVRLSGRHRVVYCLPLILLLCLPLLPSGYLDQMGTITSLGADPTGSAAERLTDLMAAGRLVQASPLTGVGVGMNALAMNAERGTTWRMVHNVYLQIAVELGIPGLIVFLVLLVRTIRKAGTARLTAARTGNGRTAFRLAEALQISLIAFAVAALFHPIGYNFYFYYIAGMSLGIGTAIRANATRGEATVA